MKKSILLLTVCLALLNCSTSIESKSNKLALDTAAQQEARLTQFIEQGYYSVDNFIQSQTVIRGELLTRLRGRVTDIVPQLSERVKFGFSAGNLKVHMQQGDYG